MEVGDDSNVPVAAAASQEERSNRRRSRPEKPSRLLLSGGEVRPISSNDFLSLMEDQQNQKTLNRQPSSHYWVRPLQKKSSSSSSQQQQPLMIDNSKLIYWSIPLPCGVTVKCRPQVLWECPGVISDLQTDLQQCLRILPSNVHSLIKQRFTVWVNLRFAYGQPHKPKHVSHSTAHHHEGWLIWAHDRPEKAPGIEIYNCWEYRKMRWHWNGCGLILHELCHLLHQYCLGLDCPDIFEAWNTCCQDPKYHRVLRRDWAGLPTGDSDMAYGLINAKEWFAELSVAYWSQGYPEFDNSNDPLSMESSSPPITSPDVLMRLHHDQQQVVTEQTSLYPHTPPTKVEPSTRNTSWQSQSGRKRSHVLPPCNKFYPFTRGQLQRWDPEVYQLIDGLWTRIAAWEDQRRRPQRCWPF